MEADIELKKTRKVTCRRNVLYACHGFSIGLSAIIIISNVLMIFLRTYLNLVFIGCISGGATVLISALDLCILRKNDAGYGCRKYRIAYYCVEMFFAFCAGAYTGLSLSWYLLWTTDGERYIVRPDDSFTVGPRKFEHLLLHYIIIGCALILLVVDVIKLCFAGAVARIERKHIRQRTASLSSQNQTNQASGPSASQPLQMIQRTNRARHSIPSTAQHVPEAGHRLSVPYIAHPTDVEYPTPYNPNFVRDYTPVPQFGELPPSYDEAIRE